jgi:type I restriction enzyme, S subunit
LSSDGRTLADACELIVDCPHSTAQESADAYAFAVGTRAISNGRIDFGKARPVAEDAYVTWTRRATPRTGDLILCREAPVGPIARVPGSPRVCLGQRTVLLRPDARKTDGAYLMYALLAPQTQAALRGLAEGSTVPHLNVADVRRFPLAPPPLDEQRRIAAVLGALDDKVDGNERLTATTLELIEAAFARLKRDPSTTTMQLGKLGTVRGGGTPSTRVEEHWEPAEVVWVTPKDMTALKVPLIAESQRRISAEGLASSSAKLLPRGTVLYTSRATLGHVAIADRDLATNQGFIAVEPDGFSSEFVLMTLRDRNEAIIAKANGSTFLEVNKTNFKAVDCARPSASALEQFDSIAGPAMRKVAAVERETRTLRAIRDELLPKLVSGAVRVPAGPDVGDPQAPAS